MMLPYKTLAGPFPGRCGYSFIRYASCKALLYQGIFQLIKRFLKQSPGCNSIRQPQVFFITGQYKKRV